MRLVVPGEIFVCPATPPVKFGDQRGACYYMARMPQQQKVPVGFIGPTWSSRGHAGAAPSSGLPGRGIIVRVVPP